MEKFSNWDDSWIWTSASEIENFSFSQSDSCHFPLFRSEFYSSLFPSSSTVYLYKFSERERLRERFSQTRRRKIGKQITHFVSLQIDRKKRSEKRASFDFTQISSILPLQELIVIFKDPQFGNSISYSWDLSVGFWSKNCNFFPFRDRRMLIFRKGSFLM